MHCPKCGEKIDNLTNYQPATLVHTFMLDSMGEPSYEQVDLLTDVSGEYECPGCRVELAHTEEDAIAFLTGEGISEEKAKYYMELAIEGR